jgi:acetyl-CoA carboxylase biotin carboxyl carrier protein
VEFKQIKELMATMGRTGTKRLVIEEEGFKIELERHDHTKTVPISEFAEDIAFRHENALHRATLTHMRGHDFYPVAHQPQQAHPAKAETAEVAPGVYITSPMVGTFYSSPSPEEPTFVKVGEKIDKHHIVCIIEAMKVMNEVKAGVSGTIAEMLVENGQPVEFGTKLFRIT